jgi:hypothetical protein
MKSVFTSVVGLSLLLASCGSPTKTAEVSGWGDATQPPPTNVCSPFLTSMAAGNSDATFIGYCDAQNNRNYGFRFRDRRATNVLFIRSTDYPSHTRQLDLVFKNQLENGLEEEYSNLLLNVVTPLLWAGDAESLKEAHRIYLEALLK